MIAAGKLLGIDPGKVRLGLAVSDPDRKFAFPLAIYQRTTPDRDAAHIQKVVREENAVGLVVGLPLHLDGREGEQAKAARALGALLGGATGLPVIFWDERFSTREAEGALWGAGLTHRQRKERRDKVAAQILLQSYLDAGCPPEQPPAPLDESIG